MPVNIFYTQQLLFTNLTQLTRMKAIFIKARKGRPGGIYAVKGTKQELDAYVELQGENLRVAKDIAGIANGTPLLFDSTLVLGTEAEYDVERVELRDGSERYLVQNPNETRALALMQAHAGEAGQQVFATRLFDALGFGAAPLRSSVKAVVDVADEDPEPEQTPVTTGKRAKSGDPALGKA